MVAEVLGLAYPRLQHVPGVRGQRGCRRRPVGVLGVDAPRRCSPPVSCSPSTVVWIDPVQPFLLPMRVAVTVVAEDVVDLHPGAVDGAVLGVGDRHLERHRSPKLNSLPVQRGVQRDRSGRCCRP